MLGFPLLYFKGMRLMMFQLSSFYCILPSWAEAPNDHPYTGFLGADFIIIYF